MVSCSAYPDPTSEVPADSTSVGWPADVPDVTVTSGSVARIRNTPARTWGSPEPAISASCEFSHAQLPNRFPFPPCGAPVAACFAALDALVAVCVGLTTWLGSGASALVQL